MTRELFITKVYVIFDHPSYAAFSDPMLDQGHVDLH